MTNLEKMLQSDNKSVRLFAETVNDLKSSERFFAIAANSVNEVDDYNYFVQVLENQNFKTELDVIYWLESELEE